MNLCMDKEKIINIGKTVGYTGIEKISGLECYIHLLITEQI